MPHERLQKFVVIDYTKEMVILAVVQTDKNEEIVGMGHYYVDENTHTAEVAFVVRDDCQNQGIGAELGDQTVQAVDQVLLVQLARS